MPAKGNVPSNLIDILHKHAIRHPERLACTYLRYPGGGGTQETILTYGELDRKVRSVAVQLQALLEPGERALVVYPSDLDFLVAYLGCLYAGVIAVPTPPPAPGRTTERLNIIAYDAGAKVILTSAKIFHVIDALIDQSPGLAGIRWINLAKLPGKAADQWKRPEIDPGMVAFLQYTSGSTANPKGVMISHKALLHNLNAIHTEFNSSQASVLVNWMPLHHDGGLIYMTLHSLFLNAHIIMMSPVDFIRKPERWLQTISHYKGEISLAPNFAYELCMRKIPETIRVDLDLSSWRVAANGAEPISAETVEKFIATFGPNGFRRDAYVPGYGLAEATVFVTSGSPPFICTFQASALEQDRVTELTPGHAGGKKLVGCGNGFPDQKIVIVDPKTRTPQPEDRVGEIWLSSPSIALGYWGKDEETKHTFCAHLANSGEGPFLRTGDLGFLYKEQLFITGRLKDLIIVQGANYYPQDIELTVMHRHPALRPGGSAAFSVEVEFEEHLVIVAELRPEYQESFSRADIIHTVRLAVAHEHGLQVYAIVLIQPGRLPKTTSGKVRRSLCRELFLQNRFDGLAHWISDEPRKAPLALTHEEMMKLVAQAFKDILNVKDISPQKDFFQAGGDSLSFVELCVLIEHNLGAPVPIDELLQTPTVENIARTLAQANTIQPLPASVLPTKGKRENPLNTVWKIFSAGDLSLSKKMELLFLLARSLAYRLGLGASTSLLPYQRGNRFLAWFSSHPLAHRTLYRQRLKQARAAAGLIQVNRPAQAVQSNLFCNSMRNWRLAALSRATQDRFARWVKVEGLENFWQAYHKNRGVILLQNHAVMTLASILALHRLGIEDLMVVGGGPRVVDLLLLEQYRDKFLLTTENLLAPRQKISSSQMLAGRQTLLRGGVLGIAADGFRGNRFLHLPFYQRSRPFGFGFAEMAQATGAAPLPVRVRLRSDGQILIRFYPSLEANGDGHQGKVNSLIGQYAAWLQGIWAQDFDNINWIHLRKYLELPHVSEPLGTEGGSNTSEPDFQGESG